MKRVKPQTLSWQLAASTIYIFLIKIALSWQAKLAWSYRFLRQRIQSGHVVRSQSDYR